METLTQILNPRDYTSASNAQADELCAGRYLAQLGLPDEHSKDADVGSLIHRALQTGEYGHLTEPQFKTYEAARAIEENVVDLWFTPSEKDKAFAAREKRLWIKIDTHWHSGKPDVVYWSPDRMLIIEYKCGWNEVPSSPHNLQLRDHVVLAVNNTIVKPEAVGVVVVQPHITLQPTVTVYQKEDQEASYNMLSARVRRSHANSARTPGEVQCQYCRARFKCLEYNQWAASGLPVVAPFVDTPLLDWSPMQMRQFLERYEKATDWLGMCHAYVKQFVKDHPGVVPGVVIKPGAIDRPVDPTKVQDLFERFEKLDGELKDFMSCLEVSKGRFEATVRAITGTKGKSLEKVMEALYKGLLLEKQKDGSLKLRKVIANE